MSKSLSVLRFFLSITLDTTLLSFLPESAREELSRKGSLQEQLISSPPLLPTIGTGTSPVGPPVPPPVPVPVGAAVVGAAVVGAGVVVTEKVCSKKKGYTNIFHTFSNVYLFYFIFPFFDIMNNLSHVLPNDKSL